MEKGFAVESVTDPSKLSQLLLDGAKIDLKNLNSAKFEYVVEEFRQRKEMKKENISFSYYEPPVGAIMVFVKTGTENQNSISFLISDPQNSDLFDSNSVNCRSGVCIDGLQVIRTLNVDNIWKMLVTLRHFTGQKPNKASVSDSEEEDMQEIFCSRPYSTLWVDSRCD